MAHSIREAAELTGRSTDAIRRAIRAGKLHAELDANGRYQIQADTLAAWIGRPAADKADEIQAWQLELDETRAALATLQGELDAAQRTIYEQSELLTRERAAADAALESQRVTTAALAALTRRLDALEAGPTRQGWRNRRRRKGGEPPTAAN